MSKALQFSRGHSSLSVGDFVPQTVVCFASVFEMSLPNGTNYRDTRCGCLTLMPTPKCLDLINFDGKRLETETSLSTAPPRCILCQLQRPRCLVRFTLTIFTKPLFCCCHLVLLVLFVWPKSSPFIGTFSPLCTYTHLGPLLPLLQLTQ